MDSTFGSPRLFVISKSSEMFSFYVYKDLLARETIVLNHMMWLLTVGFLF